MDLEIRELVEFPNSCLVLRMSTSTSLEKFGRGTWNFACSEHVRLVVEVASSTLTGSNGYVDMRCWYNPRDNPPSNGIVRHDSHLRKFGVTRPGIEPGSPWWEASVLVAQPPWPRITSDSYANVPSSNVTRPLPITASASRKTRRTRENNALEHCVGSGTKDGFSRITVGAVSGQGIALRRAENPPSPPPSTPHTSGFLPTTTRRHGTSCCLGCRRLIDSRTLPTRDPTPSSPEVIVKTSDPPRPCEVPFPTIPATSARSTQKTVTPFEFKAGLGIEMKLISNRRKFAVQNLDPRSAAIVDKIVRMKGWGKREILEKTRRPAASSGTIPTSKIRSEPAGESTRFALWGRLPR
ncbi:hypothetical protein PR048_027900 [Dryococelus australis]|uniref:Uncharacterized protein n=1 Tax=Dryococelus australis TaxID=614101 RepID=A0ABQ9GHQ6_9NEOP|nr:hypothetical protein PR048_027900 [Dryococelus australis]